LGERIASFFNLALAAQVHRRMQLHAGTGENTLKLGQLVRAAAGEDNAGARGESFAVGWAVNC